MAGESKLTSEMKRELKHITDLYGYAATLRNRVSAKVSVLTSMCMIQH